jgi:ribonuclease VapC
MIFIDASALIAIIAAEPEAAELADIIEAERTRLCSALSVWETIAGLCRSYTFSVPAARQHAGRFLSVGKFQFVGIGEREFEIAADAFAQYGKGSHPAALNMGDCYAYACAKANRAKLLFKG